MRTYSVELESDRGRTASAARLIVWAGAMASLLDGLTTFTGLQQHDISEVNALQSLAIQHYGLPGAILLRVLVGSTVFVLLAWLFGRWSGWGKRLLYFTSVAGIAATTTFVANNLSVLYLQQTLLPGAYLHGVYTTAAHLLGLVG